MGIAVKIWDKYHSCIRNEKFQICPIFNTTLVVRTYLSQISLLPMLFTYVT